MRRNDTQDLSPFRYFSNGEEIRGIISFLTFLDLKTFGAEKINCSLKSFTVSTF